MTILNTLAYFASTLVTNKASSITFWSTCGQLHTHFTLVTYSPSTIGCTIHAPVQSLQNVLAYFATAVSYDCKMFINTPPEANVIKHFMAVSYDFY